MPDIIYRIILFLAGAVLACLAFAALWVIFLMINAILISPKKVYTKHSKYHRFLLNFSTVFALPGAGVRLHVTGLDKLPKEGRFVLMGNHRSKFDPIVTWRVLMDRDIAYISKPENFKVFCFGRIIRKCCFLPINRTDPRDSLKTFMKAADLLKNDTVSIGIYPEGTRSKTLELLPFHDGTMKVAQMAKVPIVVVTTRGTENIAHNFPFKNTDVYVDFIETIPVDFITSNSSHVISARVREDMERSLSSVERKEQELSDRDVALNNQ
ncbi:MAG: 1-acyl-sn-glycerol-3-phosphate acyltransferase [Lachnospiraceae bacterium]|nr:1-acyl-sn-glycerol-3-phosphate acyltransferase [Lachnospiraceae bacterium]